MRFKSYWRTTVIGAIFLHFFVCLGLALMIPLLDFVGTPLAVQEMEVVDLPEGGDGNAEEQKPEPPKAKPPEPPKPEEQAPPPEELVMPVETSPTEAAELDEAIAEMQKQEEEAKKRAIDIFRKVGIPEPEKRFNTYPHQLSGGLRQRVMIGMAMVCDPTLMIADEPTTALDVTIEAQILYLMKQLQEERGTAIIMITHNLGVVAESCDYVYVMYAGKIMEQADVFELFKNPRHPYTFGLLNSIPKVTETKEHLYTIRGLVPNLLSLPKGCRFCTRCDRAMKICQEYEPDLYDVGGGHMVRCFLANKEVMESGK